MPGGDARSRRRAAPPRRVLLLGVALAAGLAGGVRAEGLTLASLDRSGAPAPPPGDRLSVVRPFGPWTLRCEVSLSQNRRLCAVEQVLERPGGAVLWRVARASDESNVLVWSVPPAMDPAKGLRVSLGAYSLTIPNWTCRTACLALTRVTPPLEAMLLAATTVEMAYTTGDGRAVTLSGSMAGFREAVAAAAQDPFGKHPPHPATPHPAPARPRR
ncbi:invasion associated locus B family protein [Methylobacterium aerolatum]|uniref:Invasion protein IalB n=1 Tax=Methylobacterium aerolatum TaxID=418708 RepID=A0ABU0HY14_9HYPH|nr:invasion associated locus B family protein [Methylobacterium aerolatum]MDQ0446772.1 invasion protein IalB [Methylobacterium aerolatum]GJD33738.1 hypothetical protein FMGBMHLM_0631 [Methylobacterium aerolatum]